MIACYNNNDRGYIQMHKEQCQHFIKQRQKQKRHPMRSCCELGDPVLMVRELLARKYNNEVDDSTATSQFHYFMSGYHATYSGGLQEFKLQFGNPHEYIPQYFNIARTKKIITTAIGLNAKNLSVNLIHFHQPFYYMMSRKRRHTNQQNQSSKQFNPNDMNLLNNSFINLDNPNSPNNYNKHHKVKQPLTHGQNSKKKRSIKVKDSFRLEILRLCNKIETMCKSKSKADSRRFASKLQAEAKQRKASKEELKFKNQLDSNFSAIRSSNSKNKHKSKKGEETSKQVQEIYGIASKKTLTGRVNPQQKIKKQSKPYSSRRAQTQKVELLGDSPVSQAYYPKEHNYTETAGPIKTRRKFKITSLSPISSGKSLGTRRLEISAKSLRESARRLKSKNKLKEAKNDPSIFQWNYKK